MSTLSQQNPNAEKSSPSQPADDERQGNGGALCPYCGGVSPDMTQCEHCKGQFEPLSRQATQNAMGPWQIKDPKNPFLPGCSYERLRRAVVQGRVVRSTVVRGPTTRQFWSFACNAPGVAVLLGECHACHAEAKPDEYMCAKCGVLLSPATDRQSLGLSAVTLLPGEAPAEVVASTSLGSITRPQTPTPLKAGTLKPNGGSVGEVIAQPAPVVVPAAEQSGLVVAKQLAELERRKNIESTHLRGKMLAARVIAGTFIVTTLALAVTLVVLAMDQGRGAGGGEHVPATKSVPAIESAAVPAAIDEAAGSEQEPAGDDFGFDPRLHVWRMRIHEAGLLAEKGDVESLEEATSMLRLVQDDAQQMYEGASFPKLEERLREYKARVDNLRLREML